MKKRILFIVLTGLFLFLGIFAFHFADISLLKTAKAQWGGYNFLDLTYIRRVTWLINEHYVDNQQIHPQKMFQKALEEIQETVPAIMVRFGKNNRSVKLWVNRKAKTFRLRRFNTIFDVTHQLKPLFLFIKKYYKGHVKLRKIEFAAINGILSTLDPHTNFLPPSYYNDMRIHTGGKFGGLGIVIQNRNGYLTVVSPMSGTPAWRAGIKPLDRIVRINDQSTINMSLIDAVNILRGKPGTKVTIWIMRKGFNKPKPFTIVRAEIKVISVTSALLKNKIAYIRIKNFQQNTTGDVHSALRKMTRQTGGLRGLILDLRDNPGGLLTQAIKISDTFLKKGIIVTHAGSSVAYKAARAKAQGTEPNYPIVVLINQGSASASEIVAGALRNNDRALVLGQRSYGKGTVQILYPIMRLRYSKELSALKLTVAQYLTPGGISIQKIGISPDVRLRPILIEKTHIQFYSGDEKKKQKPKKLPRYLKGVREHRKPLFDLAYFDTLTTKERLKRYKDQYTHQNKVNMDFEIELARKLLIRTHKSQRPAFFQDVKNYLKKVQHDEWIKIKKALKKRGVLWEDHPSPKKVHLSVHYRLLPVKSKKKGKHPLAPKGLNVKAGATFRLQVTIRNLGRQKVYKVRAITSSPYWFLNKKEFVFGTIKPRQYKRWSVIVNLPKWVKTQAHLLKLNIHNSNPDFLLQKDLLIKIHGARRPLFAFSYAIEERKGNGDQLIQAGESVNLRIAVRNLGPGKAAKVVALLKNKTGPELFIEKGRLQLGALRPGQNAIARFQFRLKKNIYLRKLKIKITIFDAELLTTVTEMIHLRLYPTGLDAMKIAPMKVRVKERWSWIYSGASFDAPIIARTRRNSTFRVLRRLGPFFQIRFKRPLRAQKRKGHLLKNYWTGWIPARDVKKTHNRLKKHIKFYWQYVTPKITVFGIRHPLITHRNNYRLRCFIRNNKNLEDVYIIVNNQKVYYRALRNRSKLKVNLSLKLKKGRNHVIIFARETENFLGYKEFFILRK